MRSASFSIARRNATYNNTDRYGRIIPEVPDHILMVEVHIKKTSGRVLQEIKLHYFLLWATLLSVIITGAIAVNSSSSFFALTFFDVLGLVGYLRNSTTVMKIYHRILGGCAFFIVSLLGSMSVIGAHRTSNFLEKLDLGTIAHFIRENGHADVATLLFSLLLFILLRVAASYKYAKHITFKKLFAKLKSNNFILDAEY